ncbi:BTAD domain-containing putative transcriptional regulator [Amycolatopsis sp. YIM 10]|uniref:BTAD domain-containing putative transcriptional regulator n=1 Tax=Amycolatopsis sp. YIM 10 TaxID=2653857 RepID=UPI001290841A|nr:BTAD domain-containing putative transcriptional regulator [Amycolatopsis sp. YIM 10]
MRVVLLGPVRVHADQGPPITLGGARLRMLLARLALAAGRVVTAEALAADLWGGEPPADAANALQSLVSRLRKALPETGVLTSAGGGYQLAADVDAARFETLAAQGRAELKAGRPEKAAAQLSEALALWQGPALADILDAGFAHAPAARLDDLRTAAHEDWFDAELAIGRHAEVLADLEAAADRHPLRERLAALRMRALSMAGRQSEALAVFENVRQTLADELGVDPSPELTETHLAVLRGELPKPVKAAAAAHPAAFPARLTSFVGRDEELATIAARLAEHRLVTLVGPGGAGKTRLATEAAVRHPEAEQGRAWFVPLAGVRNAADVPAAVSAALGIRERRVIDSTSLDLTRPDVLDQVAEVLGHRPCLLLLDNCEHVIEAVADFTSDLLARIPGLRVLTTSREALAITGEVLCPLGPLGLPSREVPAEQAAAVRLFTDRATAVSPTFTLDESSTAAVVEICHRLDGMPLALELAAARLRSMTATQIAQRLDDRFRLLTSGSRSALPRQRTLRAVVEWSWDLLDEPERVLARRLSVFSAGATIEAIERVCDADVLYVLGSLVEKSIVDARPDEGGQPRYRMLETIRAYADERLAEAGERKTYTRRYVDYYVELAERQEPRTRTPEQLEAIAVFDAEYDNMMTALRWAIREHEPEPAHRLALAMLWIWMVRGQHPQAVEIAGEMIAFGAEIPRYATATFRLVHGMTDAVLRGGEGVPDFRELVDDCVESGAAERFPMLAIALPMVSFMIGDRELADREIARARNSGDKWARASGQWVHGFVLGDRGDREGANVARAGALSEFEALGDRWGMSMAWGMVAEDRSLRGDHEGAIEAFRRGYEMARELDLFEEMGQQVWRLALERARAGDLVGAWADMAELERLQADHAHDELAIFKLYGKAELARRSGDFALCRETLAELAEWPMDGPFPPSTTVEWTSRGLAALALSEGRFDEARKQLAISARATTTRRDMADLARNAEVLALVRHREGDATSAATMLGLSEALRGIFDLGDPDLIEAVESLTAVLGESAYQDAYLRGSRLSKEDATAELFAQVGISDQAEA